MRAHLRPDRPWLRPRRPPKAILNPPDNRANISQFHNWEETPSRDEMEKISSDINADSKHELCGGGGGLHTILHPFANKARDLKMRIQLECCSEVDADGFLHEHNNKSIIFTFVRHKWRVGIHPPKQYAVLLEEQAAAGFRLETVFNCNYQAVLNLSHSAPLLAHNRNAISEC